MEPVPKGEPSSQSTPKAWRSITPRVPDHELLRRIGEGSYGEVWLARNTVGTLRAVKVVYRNRFKDERPYEREFSGIQKYEPISRSNEGLVDVLQIGRNDAEHYFYYVMELADDAGSADAASKPAQGSSPSVESYVPKTLAQQIRLHRRLSVQECITLGLNLNLALGHLHRNGLIHRDVKPSNIIFVNGVPKLADIGLVTEMAEAESFVGTEGFIPPEGPNSPQADIYALGKVLYEASMAKDRREFPEPYSDLGTDSESHALMELNSVLLKACAPNPKQRYQSAEDMNADLALLHSGKSVQQKQMLERRLTIATRTGIALAAVLVLGAIPYYLAISQTMAAKRSAKNEAEQHKIAVANQRKAEAEAAKSAQIAKLLRDMLLGVDPSSARGKDTSLLREIMDKTNLGLSRALTNQPEVEIYLKRTLGQVYYRIGAFAEMEKVDLEALALAKSLDRTNQSLIGAAMYGVALACMEQGKLDEAETLARGAVVNLRTWNSNSTDHAEAANILGCVLLQRGKLEEAEQMGREAVGVYKRQEGAQSEGDVARCLGNLGLVLMQQGKAKDAETEQREVLAIQRKLVGPEHVDIVTALNQLVSSLSEQGKDSEAGGFLREQLTMSISLFGTNDPHVATAYGNLGNLLQLKNPVEAEQALLLSIEIKRKLLGTNNPSIAFPLNTLAMIYVEQKRFDEARQAAVDALALRKPALGPDHVLIADLLNVLAEIEKDVGHFELAEAYAMDAMVMRRKLFAPEHPKVLPGLMGLGEVLWESGKFERARQTFTEGLKILREHPEMLDSEGLLESIDGLLSNSLQNRTNLVQAEPLGRECLSVRRIREPESWETANSMSLYGAILSEQKEYDKAEPLLLAAYEGLKQHSEKIPDDQRIVQSLAAERLARLYEAKGVDQSSRQWRETAAEIAKRLEPASK